MAKAENFVDNFDDNSLSAQWSVTTLDVGVTITETQQQLQIALPNATGRYGNLDSTTTYDMTDSFIQCQLINAGVQTNLDVCPVYISNGTDNIFWDISGGVCSATTHIAAVDTTRGTNFNYSAAIHKFFRLMEKAGTFYWQWSTDGKGWVTHFSMATSSLITMTALTLRIQAGTFGLPGSVTTCRFDNFNYVGRLAIPSVALRPHAFSPGIAR